MENSVAVINVRECSPKIDSDELQENDPANDDNTEKDESYWNVLYGLVILPACALNTSVLTMILRNNSIFYPEYWYEGLFCIILGVSFRHCLIHILELFV